jgi:hypothetical protein
MSILSGFDIERTRHYARGKQCACDLVTDMDSVCDSHEDLRKIVQSCECIFEAIHDDIRRAEEYMTYDGADIDGMETFLHNIRLSLGWGYDAKTGAARAFPEASRVIAEGVNCE